MGRRRGPDGRGPRSASGLPPERDRRADPISGGMARIPRAAVTPLLAFLVATLCCSTRRRSGSRWTGRGRRRVSARAAAVGSLGRVARTRGSRGRLPEAPVEPPEDQRPSPSRPAPPRRGRARRSADHREARAAAARSGRCRGARATTATPIVAWVQRVSRRRPVRPGPGPLRGRDATGWMPLRGLDIDRDPRSGRGRPVRAPDRGARRGDRVRVPRAGGDRRPGIADTDRPLLRHGPCRVPRRRRAGDLRLRHLGDPTDLPAGWTGGDQLAIHGTNDAVLDRTVGERRLPARVRADARPARSRCCELGTPVIVRP